jgi:hypothetical protein
MRRYFAKFSPVRSRWIVGTMLLALVLAIAVAAQQTSSLVIAGQPGSAKVAQVNGHNYVEVEGLARMTGAALSFNGNQIVMNMPLPGAVAQQPAAQAAPPPPPPPPPGFSKGFVAAGIEAMSQVREWHAALKNAIQGGYPLRADWLNALKAQAQQSLRLAGLAVSTDSDRNVMPFLTNEFNNMSQLSDKYVQKTVSMSYFGRDALANDPIDQKIVACAHSLASMATTNQFIDDGSCE